MTAPEHSDLPLPDYDHLPVPAVAQRIRSLDGDQLGQLLDYERAHAGRPAVVQVMRARLAELREGAEPADGGRGAGQERPESGEAQRPADVRPATQGPPSFPPPHGLPAQPARPKADKQSQ